MSIATSTTVYACTHMDKMASDWSPTEGAGTSYRCIMDESCNIRADSLPLLIERIGARYFLAMDSLFVSDDDSEVSHVGFNRVETGDSDEPSNAELAEWEAGNLTLYLCDYTFSIEKRTVSPITLDEFASAGIETH